MPGLFFPSIIAKYIFYIVFACWVLLDIRLFAKKKENKAINKDKNSASIIIFISTIAIWGAFFVTIKGIGLLDSATKILFFTGICLMLFGITLRHYSVHILGKYFTVQVQIHKDHHLVETGPYKYIRHPSYTGTNIILLGLGLILHNWIAFLLLTIPSLIATAYRISIEEKALTDLFGDEYRKYMKRTGKFLPNFLYIAHLIKRCN